MNEQAVAWRCENCRRWQPVSLASHAIIVDDVGDWAYTGAVKRRRRFTRQMVVCGPCRRSIVGDLPGEQEGQST